MNDIWTREPSLDKRFSRGDDFAGDAWRHSETGEVQYTAVDQRFTHDDCIDQFTK